MLSSMPPPSSGSRTQLVQSRLHCLFVLDGGYCLADLVFSANFLIMFTCCTTLSISWINTISSGLRTVHCVMPDSSTVQYLFPEKRICRLGPHVASVCQPIFHPLEHWARYSARSQFLMSHLVKGMCEVQIAIPAQSIEITKNTDRKPHIDFKYRRNLQVQLLEVRSFTLNDTVPGNK